MMTRLQDMFDSEFCPGKMMDAGVAAKYQESVRAWAWLLSARLGIQAGGVPINGHPHRKRTKPLVKTRSGHRRTMSAADALARAVKVAP